MDDRADQRLALAEAARSVVRAARVTEIDAAGLDRATELLNEAAAILGAETHEGPHCQIGWGPDGWNVEIEPAQLFPYSPVVGPLNPVSPLVEVTINADASVSGTMHLTEQYTGPPWDLSHGGVIAMVFDELLGIAAVTGGGGGFTGRLTVRYRKPTPILADIELSAGVEEVRGRKITAKGQMRHDGVVTAEAEGLFIKPGPPPADEG